MVVIDDVEEWKKPIEMVLYRNLGVYSMSS